MLTNLDLVETLVGLARSRARDFETKTVHASAIEEHEASGWVVSKKNKKSVRLTRPKSCGTLLEDRVWMLFYRMRFRQLSSRGGAWLQADLASDSPKTQIDIVAIDDEVAIAIECKSSEQPARRPQFSQELGKHSLIRDKFTQDVRAIAEPKTKRLVVLAMFTSNIVLSDNDKARASEANVLLLDQIDLAYYETLVGHIGPAAKYQFLADIFPGKTIPNLDIRVPAIRTKMGAANCYTFSISPEYLLKISYVSHRAKGRASDVDTYQRMLSKGRLNKIRQYIDDGGIFPTNIVLNINKNRLTFQRSVQEEGASTENGLAGWLDIKAAYKSAWIIDGQHRLFAYSGHSLASKSRVAVLAFEGLAPSEQARLFIDINAKQKSVKQSLLQELYAELHWDAEDDQVRLRAIISKAVQQLDTDSESPLFNRVQTADAAKSETRCVSLTSLYGAIERADFHIAKMKHNQVIEYGPLWAGENTATLKRTVYILKYWLTAIRDAVPDWWAKGSGEGGGLAMNDGITTCIMVLKSVFETQSAKLIHLDEEDLADRTARYAAALGTHLAKLSEQERKTFRDLRGVQGQTRRWRQCQEAIRASIPTFNPEGLDKYLAEVKAQTNSRGKDVLDHIEKILQTVVVEELKREMPGNDDWWTLGVPKPVRLKVTQRFEEDDGQRGSKECYFDLVDYQKIAMNRWDLFQSFLGKGTGGKEKQMGWMNILNARRNIVAHPSSGKTLTVDELAELEEIQSWLETKSSNAEAATA